jgi:flagellar biosynthesis/type III secretory pathway protein FliH
LAIQAHWTPPVPADFSSIVARDAYNQGIAQLQSQKKNLIARILKLRKRVRLNLQAQLVREKEAMNIALQIQQQTQYREIVARANQDCLDLAITIAGEFLETLPKEGAAYLAKKISSRIDQLVDKSAVQISVHPSIHADILNSLGKDRAVLNIVSSIAVDPGSAVIETKSGKVICSIQQDFQEISRELQIRLAKSLHATANPKERSSQ